MFTAEVISPLFDLANPNSELARKVEEQVKAGLTSVPNKPEKDKPEKEDGKEGATNGQSAAQQQQSQQSPADAQGPDSIGQILA